VPEDGTEYSLGDTVVSGLVYAGTECSFSDSSVAVGDLYYYRLFAADGLLSYSDPITLTITFTDGGMSGVEAPLLQDIRQGSYFIEVSWTSTDSNTVGFIIARAETEITWNPRYGEEYLAGDVVDGAEIVRTGTAERYTDSDVLDGHEYYYKIFAYNNDRLYSAGLQVHLLFETETEPGFDRVPRVDNYFIYYGELTPGAIDAARKYDLVIIHPNNNSTVHDRGPAHSVRSNGIGTSGIKLYSMICRTGVPSRV